MRLKQGDIAQGVLDKIRETTDDVPPPSVLTALLALTRGQEMDHAAASYESSSEAGTTWHIVACAGHALITVDASSPRSAWTLDYPRGEVLADDERLDALLRPLGDVAAVQVVRTAILDTSGDWLFNAQWRLTLRDGTPVDIRAGRRTNSAREACDEFARHIIDAIASTSGDSAPAVIPGEDG